MKQFFIITFFSMLISYTTALSQTIPKEGCVECIDNNAFINGRTTTAQFTLFGKGEIRPGFVLTALNENGDAYWSELATGVSGSLWQINLNEDLYTHSKVGIGTDTPQFDLHVQGTTFIEYLRLYPTFGPVIEPGFVLTAIDNLGNTIWAEPTGTGTASPWLTNDDNIYYNTGNVGIGTSTPQAKLHVSGTIALNSEINFKTSEAEIIWGSGNMLLKGYKDDFLDAGFYTIMALDSKTGNVGIGITDPTHKLHVEGSLFTQGFTLVDPNSPPSEGYLLTCNSDGIASWTEPMIASGLWKENTNNQGDIYFDEGNVGIGTMDTYGYKLAVNGKIITTEVTVKLYTSWPDYVFGSNYQLESLTNVENYINTNKHLPGVPTAQEVQEKGIKLGEMNVILLQKIEELMLYTIEQQKMLENQLQMLESQQKQIDGLRDNK